MNERVEFTRPIDCSRICRPIVLSRGAVQALPPQKRRLRGKQRPPVARMRCFSSYLEFAQARSSMKLYRDLDLWPLRGSQCIVSGRCTGLLQYVADELLVC